MVALLAVLAIGIAGVAIVRSVREELKERTGAIRLASAPFADAAPDKAKDALGTAEDPGAIRSRLAVLHSGKGGPDRSVVMLGRPACSEDFEGAIKGTFQGLLIQELFRQSLLIAARDELGLATRDEVLGESLAAASKNEDLELATVVRKGGIGRAAVLRPGDRDKKKDRPLDLFVKITSLPEAVEVTEKLSRTEFPTVLKALKLKGAANSQKDDAALPEGVEASLARLGQSDQFAAIRRLHAAIRADGESPVRLAALARAYALLGVLTEFHWHPAHKVFKARALLYAQRLVARTPNEPVALWNRAYVRALVGMHFGARSDLTEAEKLAKANEASPKAAPSWVPLIDAYIRYEIRQIKTEEGSLESFAGLLRLLAAEFPRLKTRTVPAAKELLAREPDCFRAIDAVCDIGGLGDLHVVTVLGPQILDQVVPKKLKTIEGLPEPVREVIDSQKGGPALVAALLKASEPDRDQGEPSWGTLSRLLAESRFVHVARRLTFMRNEWSVPIADYWAESHLSVAGHRFQPYLESLTLPPNEAVQVLTEFFAKLDISDFELTGHEITRLARSVPCPRSTLPWRAALLHVDHVAHDEAQATQETGQSLTYAKRLLGISPRSPFGRAVLIEKDWENSKQHLAEWEKDPATSDSPALLGALSKRYTEMDRADDARDALRKYVELAPEKWAYVMLAENAKARNDLKLWKATLDEFLERAEETGLDHANVRVQIAQHFMGLGQWSKALPYAETAARTGAGWAQECAGRCNEGMRVYDRAEFWFRSESERYPRSFMQWFDFCKRSLHGDIDGATALADSFIKRAGENLTENEMALGILLYDLANQPAEGIAFLKTLPENPAERPTPSNRFEHWIEQLFMAMFADAVDDTKLRDQCWTSITKAEHPDVAIAAAMFRDALDPKANKPFDVKEFAALMLRTDAKASSYLHYFAGHFLERHGKLDDAIDSWERCYGNSTGGTYVPLMASEALRRRLDGKIPDDSDLYYMRGYYHHLAEQLEPALKDLDKAIELDPKSVKAYNLRGVVKRAAGDLDGAIADFTRMIELAPDEPSGRFLRGMTRVIQGRDEDAKADIEQGLKAAPENGMGHAAKGLLFLAQGNHPKAEEMFDQALAYDSNLGSPLEHLKRMVAKARGGKQ